MAIDREWLSDNGDPLTSASDTKPGIPVLKTRKVLRKASDRLEGRTSNGGSRVDEISAEEIGQDMFGVVQCWRPDPHAFQVGLGCQTSLLFEEDEGVAGHHGNVRSSIEDLTNLCEVRGQELIVAVETGQVPAMGFACGDVTRPADPVVVLTDQPDASVRHVRLNNAGHLVGGAIVDDDQLPIRPGLPQD